MRTRILKSLATALLFVVPTLVYANKLPVPELETLPNGLKLAWFINDSLPVIDLSLLIQGGYRNDPLGKSGTAELLAATLDRGAAGKSAREIARAVEMLGATRFCAAGDDGFTIGMHGLAPDAPVLLELLSKIALKPEFPAEEVKREHARILDRWSHVADYGEALASLAFDRLVSQGTDYDRGGFVSPTEFNRVGREDLLQYHRTVFVPGNAILMIVGRVDRVEFRKKIVEAFGSWPSAVPGPQKKIQTPRLKTAKAPAKKIQVVLVDRPGLSQAQVRLGFRAPLFQSPDHYNLAVLNALVGEYFHSRLNSLIRDELGLSYGIGSSFSYSKDFAKFMVASSTRNEMAGQLISHTLKVLNSVRSGAIEQAEVDTAKEYLVGSFPLSVSTLAGVAGRWLSGYFFNLGPEYLNEFIPKVSATQRQGVISAAAKHLDLDHLIIVVAGDGKEIQKSLLASGFKNFKRVAAQDLLK